LLISTKGRYAIRVMIDLAENRQSGYVPLRDVAERQQISEKYLESIISLLSKAGLVEGIRGKGGGYRLTREPEEYTAWEILNVANGTMAPVACLKDGAPECDRQDICKSLSLYENIYELMELYLGEITLPQLVSGEFTTAEEFAGMKL
jgi:Rrf2 family iron-sulfur cluster assembly transcriptional regulator